jgi:hypothetical protein
MQVRRFEHKKKEMVNSVFAGSPRQSAQDFAGYASSIGQASIWQDTGSLSVVYDVIYLFVGIC